MPQIVSNRALPEMADWAPPWTPRQAAVALSKWRSLLNLGSAEEYAGHSVIFSRGDTPHEVFLLARGIAKLTLPLPSGEESLLTLRYPGQFVDYCSHDLGTAYPLSGITIVPSDIYKARIEQVRAARRRNPDLRIHEADLLRRDLYRLAAMRLRLKALSPVDRLERLLWDLASVIGERDSTGEMRLVLPLDNCEMASLCGLSESHYKTIRRELERTGRVSHDGRHLCVLTRNFAGGSRRARQ